jgi:hypothetical protein
VCWWDRARPQARAARRAERCRKTGHGRAGDASEPGIVLIVGRRQLLVVVGRGAAASVLLAAAGRRGRLRFNDGKFVECVALRAADVEALLFEVQVFVCVHKGAPMAAHLALELWAEKNLNTSKNQVTSLIRTDRSGCHCMPPICCFHRCCFHSSGKLTSCAYISRMNYT